MGQMLPAACAETSFTKIQWVAQMAGYYATLMSPIRLITTPSAEICLTESRAMEIPVRFCQQVVTSVAGMEILVHKKVRILRATMSSQTVVETILNTAPS